MLDDIKYKCKELIKSRIFVLSLVFVCLFSILIIQCFRLQIIKGESYMDEYTLLIQKTRTVDGTRGNIYDRNGVLLAYNVLAYSVTIEDNGDYETLAEKNEILNANILEVIEMIESRGDNVINNFGITIDDQGEYCYVADEGTKRSRFIADVYGRRLITELTEEEATISAPDMIAQLCSDKKYGIDASVYDKNLVLKLINIRYEMSLNGYTKYIPTTIAQDVSNETVAAIMENSSELQGIDIGEEYLREYADSKYFASILGYTGQISSDEYDSYVEEGIDSYSLSDVVGKTGIEQYMDTELQGTDGEEIIYVNSVGKITDTISKTESISGNDLYLSIDSQLQKVGYDVLEEILAGIILSKLQNTLTFDNSSVSKASEIMIPIGDVYHAFFVNSILDVDAFDDEDAGPTEQKVLATYLAKETEVTTFIADYLQNPNGKSYKNLTDEQQDYIDYTVNTILKTNGKVLVGSSIDTNDVTYKKWTKDGSINIYNYLNYAIDHDWIDTTMLENYLPENANSNYSSTEEIYVSIVNYVTDKLSYNTGLENLIYQHLILDRDITGEQICLMAMEQNVIDYTESEYTNMKAGATNVYRYLYDKIKSLEITPGQLGLEPSTASMVIVDPNTGETLALIDYPGYDNNKLANTVDSAYYNDLLTNSATPLYNHATQEKTAPGSTFKMVTSAAGLTENVITTNTIINCSGEFEKVVPSPKCWIYPHTHGNMNVVTALQNSCNDYFYEVGYRLSMTDRAVIGTDNAKGNTTNLYYSSDLGISALEKYATMFGLGEKSGVEISETTPQISDTFSIPSAIGQGTHNYTTSQLARYTATVANEGTVYDISLLDKLVDKEGNTIEDYTPTVNNTITEISDSTWGAIHQGMKQVVQYSSVFKGVDNSLSIAGKTGTAQQSTVHADHGLFVGFSPVSNPEMAVSVRITYGYSSAYAAQAARDVIRYYWDEDVINDIVTGEAATLGAVTAGD